MEMFQCPRCPYMNGDKPLTELHILREHIKLKPIKMEALLDEKINKLEQSHQQTLILTVQTNGSGDKTE